MVVEPVGLPNSQGSLQDVLQILRWPDCPNLSSSSLWIRVWMERGSERGHFTHRDHRCRDGSVVKCACCSCRGLKFCSQYLHLTAHNNL